MRLENTTGGSSKFWQIEVKGKECHVRYGKIGSEGRSRVKAFESVAEAEAYAKSKSDEKLNGAYVVADGFDGTSNNSIDAPSLPSTAGGILASRLDIANAPKDFAFDAADFKRSADALKGLGESLSELIEKLVTYVPKEGPLHGPVDPQIISDLKNKRIALVGLMASELSALDSSSPSGALLESNVQKMKAFADDLTTFKEKMELPFVLMLSGTMKLEQSLKALKASFPNLEKLKEPPPALLNANAFAALSKSEKASLAINAEMKGYQIEPLHDDDDAETFAKSFMSASAIDEMFDHLVRLAEDDSDSSDDEPEIGDPSFSEALAIKSGNEIIAYQIETHINWQPADIDIIGVHYVDLKGEIFENDWR